LDLTVDEIQRSTARTERLRRFYWDFFFDLSYQRHAIFSELKSTLRAKVAPFEFADWVRVITNKYSNAPLSAKGSALNSAGGRFNFGCFEISKFPPFSALYLAQDFEVAYREKFGTPTTSTGGLTSADLALCRGSSFSSVALRGKTYAILDISAPDTLDDFVDLIKGFKISKSVLVAAARLGFSTPRLITTVTELRDALAHENWRLAPQVLDLPAPSQIFGQLAFLAGVDGILYPSTKLATGRCLAVFPANLTQSASYIEIQDSAPIGVTITRLDSSTCAVLT
jgi:hypothetical protein